MFVPVLISALACKEISPPSVSPSLKVSEKNTFPHFPQMIHTLPN